MFWRAGEGAQWLKDLFCKHKDPYPPHKEFSTVMSIYNPSVGWENIYSSLELSNQQVYGNG